MKKSHDVLLLISPMPPQRFQGVARLAKACGWHLMIENRKSPPLGWRGDGVLVMLRDDPVLKDFIRNVRRRGTPVVDILDECPGFRLPRVTGDNGEIGRLAAEHFAERDFRRAVLFSLDYTHVHRLRFDGFKAAWTGERPEEWIWRKEAGRDFRDWGKMEEWLVERLRNAVKPVAIFAWNDYDATHVLDACRQAGVSVPDEVAILGTDDDRLLCENQRVEISSVRHDHERISYAAAATLERLMCGGEPDDVRLRIKPQGIAARASTDVFAVNDPDLKPAVDYIMEHLGSPMGAAQIAAALGVPRVRLDRLFAARLGRSVGKEILRRRIAQAKKLLARTEDTIGEIAEACGFCHASFMIKAFRKATGTTPNAWRQNARG